MDIKTAFLNAEEFYMKHPEGFEQLDSKANHVVCMMRKSRYDLKQSGRNWFLTFGKLLCSIGSESLVELDLFA